MIENVQFGTLENPEIRKLSELSLNFCNEKTKQPYKTIIIAGENGTYKTTILETIVSFITERLRKSTNAIKFITTVSLDGHNEYDHVPIYNDKRGSLFVRVDTNIIDSRIPNLIVPNAIYIQSNVEFEYNKENSTSRDKYNISMKMLSDICLKDQTEMAREYFRIKYCDSSKKQMPELMIGEYTNIIKLLNLYTFVEAFNNFFQDKQLMFKGVGLKTNNVPELLFEKNSNEFAIDKLSSGEKQIVFKGTHVIDEKNKHKGDKICLFVDEPELNMHPKWQKRILKYYQDLLSDGSGNQTAQLIVATHSPYIIESAMTGVHKDETLIIILKEENDGKIKPTRIFYDGNKWTTDDNNQNKTFLLPSSTIAEINRRVFDIFSKDYLFQLYSLLSDTIDEKKKNKEDYKYVSCNKCIQIYIEENIQKYIDKDKDTKDQEKYTERVRSYYIRGHESLPTFLRNAYAHVDFNNKQKRDTVEEYKYTNSEGKEIVADQDTQIKDACEILENIISDYNILSDDRIQELIEKCKNDNKKNDKNGTK